MYLLLPSQKVSTTIHPKNVHENSPKEKKLPKVSTRNHCPREVSIPFVLGADELEPSILSVMFNLELQTLMSTHVARVEYVVFCPIGKN
jgi:hypothetical protein